jgi:alkylation response protein AidB-like acyl-CoA dehydrogenase
MESEDGYELDVWRQMADQLGIQALIIPERYGGAGFGPAEAAIVFEEFGRTLLSSPLLAVSIATNVLLDIDDESAREDLLPGIADGRIIATLAVCDESGQWGEDAISVDARADSADHLLTGCSGFVLDGAVADVVLVLARSPDGPSLYAVDGRTNGLRRERLVTLDETRRLAHLTFAQAPARPIGAPGSAWPAITHALDLTLTSLAAEHVGGTEALLEMSVSYAQTRRQFGRAIGSFQAIKHKCAEMLVGLESARSAAGYAAWAAVEDPGELPAAAALATAYCTDAFVEAAKTTIQIHGGIGFTWEHDAHLFLRRAKTSQLLFGSPSHHRDVLAGCIGL